MLDSKPIRINKIIRFFLLGVDILHLVFSFHLAIIRFHIPQSSDHNSKHRAMQTMLNGRLRLTLT